MGKFRLPSWDETRFSVAPNRPLFEELTAAMLAHNESIDLGPWMRLPEEQVSGTMELMLDPWCGVLGQIPLLEPSRIADCSGKPHYLEDYHRYLRSIDHYGLLNDVTFEDLGQRGWRLFDLGSLIDFLLISAFVDFQSKRTNVLEIGGGFGRLAEFLPLVTNADFRYINIDAAPVSLMYSYEYLRARFPEKRVVMFSPEKKIEDYDFLIVPTWHADALPKEAVDLVINVESMQEMNQTLVDYYLSYIDERTPVGSHIYLVNSREWLFKGTWNFPPSWEVLYRHRTVRAWTPDQPAELFRKADVVVEAVNRLRKAAFDQEVDAVRQIAELAKYKHLVEIGHLVPADGVPQVLQDSSETDL
ncbi:putative sugar O-methyltransferase [Microvirga sp. BT689]|uniref:putative sugar O-methyltransferase n=1 Tax=Microvirga arvi TaxID=2778731 RepID=UPI0019505AE7|nr:putative sugar O-methyltransferase [Microvirga arvi]MBM6582641.1 putative sugar O-methyltransferase [Microvirga arvi]